MRAVFKTTSPGLLITHGARMRYAHRLHAHEIMYWQVEKIAPFTDAPRVFFNAGPSSVRTGGERGICYAREGSQRPSPPTHPTTPNLKILPDKSG